MKLPTPSTSIGQLVVLAMALMLVGLGGWAWGDRLAFDMQSRWLFKNAPSALPRDVVVIGVDQAAIETLQEPYPLWPQHWGTLLGGLSQSGASVVGLALPLAPRSYDFLRKGLDQPLLDSLRLYGGPGPRLVLGQTETVQGPPPLAPEILATLPPGSLARLLVCEDADGVVRSTGCAHVAGTPAQSQIPEFGEAVAHALGRDGRAQGLIDYTSGNVVSYLPFMTVLEWIKSKDLRALKQALEGRVVLVVSVLADDARHHLPVTIAAWATATRSVSPSMVQVPVVRSLIGHGLMEVPSRWQIYVGAVLMSLAWLGRSSWRKTFVFVAFFILLIGSAVYSTKQGVFYPVGTLALIALAAYLARLVWDAVRHAQEKSLLRSAFSGHVSPQVMRAILSGKLQPDRDGENCQATILFCDIRGFTTRAESATPEAMMTLLNRFYAEVTAAVHARAGAIDKFLGDGLLATFGVLQPLKSPQRSALEAAQEILVRISRLNQALQAQGLDPIEVGIGIHCGPVLAGYVGSRKRREFTVMGDVVNTAFGLEGLTKVLGLPVVCSEPVARAVGFSAGLQDMGEQAIKGRAAMRVWGWRPPLVKHAKGAGVC